MLIDATTKQKLQQLRKRAAVRGLLDDPMIRNSFRTLQYMHNPKLLRFLEYTISEAEKEFPVPDIELGIDADKGKPCGLFMKHLHMNIGIFGSSGQGKTLLLQLLVKELLARGIPIAVVDTSPDHEWNSLLENEYGKNVFFYDIETEGLFNPLSAPKGVDQERWDRDIARVFASNLSLQYSSGHLLDILRTLRSENEYPTLQQLKQHTHRMVSTATRSDWRIKDGQYLSTLDNALRLIPLDYVTAFSSCDRGSLQSLLESNKSIVIRTDISDEAVKVFTELLYLYIIRFQLERQDRVMRILVIEEAHHNIMRRHPNHELSVAPFLLQTASRKANLGVIMTAHSPEELSEIALNSTASKISFGFGSADHRSAMARHMDINAPGDRALFDNLSVGQCFIKVPDQPARLMLVPELYSPSVRDEDIEGWHRRNANRFAVPLPAPIDDPPTYPLYRDPGLQPLPPQEPTGLTTQEAQSVPTPDPIPTPPPTEPDQEPACAPSPQALFPEQGHLSVFHETVLRCYCREPYLRITLFDALLRDAFEDLNTKNHRKYREELIEQEEMLCRHKLSGCGTKGRPPEFLVPTDTGQHYCTKYLQLQLPKDPRGDSGHSFLLYCIKRYYEARSRTVNVSLGVNITTTDAKGVACRKEVDLVMETSSSRIAVEVNHTNTANLRTDVEKVLRAEPAFDEVIVVNMLTRNKQAFLKRLQPLRKQHPQLVVEPDAVKYITHK